MRRAPEAAVSAPPGEIHWPSAEATVPIPLIHRPHLRALLLKAFQRRLTLVVAPSGFGKTIALRDAVAACGSASIWLGITSADSSAERLARRVTETVFSIAGARAVRPGPQGPGRGVREDPDILVRDRHFSGLHLVFDGVNESPSPDLIASFALRLLGATPAGVRVAIAGTLMPMVALDGLARFGQLAIIGPDRLAFSRSEAKEALRGWGCGEEDAAMKVAYQVTAGWPRGIAAIAAAFPEKPAEGEILRSSIIWACRPTDDIASHSLDPVDREILLSISVLPTIKPADADALTGVPGIGQRLRGLLGSGSTPMAHVGGRYVIENRARSRLNAVLAAEIGTERMSERWAAAGRILEVRGDLEDALSAYVKAGDGARASRVLQSIGLTSVLDRDPSLLSPLADGLARCAELGDHGRAVLGFMALVREPRSFITGIQPQGADRGTIPGTIPASPDSREEPDRFGDWQRIANLLPEPIQWTMLWDAWRLLDLGAGREAKPLIRQAVEALAGGTQGFQWTWALICMARLHCHRGEYGAARAVLARVVRMEFLVYLADEGALAGRG